MQNMSQCDVKKELDTEMEACMNQIENRTTGEDLCMFFLIIIIMNLVNWSAASA